MEDKFARFKWAIECLQLRPDDTVLEIGPGAGLALELMQSSVHSLVAVERSALMLKRIRERLGRRENFQSIEGDLLNVDLNGHKFTKIFAFNVSGFLTNKSMFQALLPHLSKGASVGIFYQNPPGSTQQKLLTMLQQLKQNAEKCHLTPVMECRMSPPTSTPTGGTIFQLQLTR